MAIETKVTVFNVGDPGGDNKKLFILKAPSAGNGGGIRILGVKAVNGAATSGGTTFTLALHKYSSAGTPAVNGTIASAIGGTTDYWADGVPKDFTLNASYTFLDAGEWLALQYNEVSSGNPTLCSVAVEWALGK